MAAGATEAPVVTAGTALLLQSRDGQGNPMQGILSRLVKPLGHHPEPGQFLSAGGRRSTRKRHRGLPWLPCEYPRFLPHHPLWTSWGGLRTTGWTRT